MKFMFIAPGELPIPPIGWGALETVVGAYCKCLQTLKHEVYVSNHKDPYSIFKDYYKFQPDIIHLAYGKHWEVMPFLRAKAKLVTSYDGSFVGSQELHRMLVLNYFNDCHLCPITNMEKSFFRDWGVPENKISVIPSGVETKLFQSSSSFHDKSLYLGKIDKRKRQAYYQKLGIDCRFVGNCSDNDFVKDSNYLGVWTRAQVYENMGEFDNLVLLSEAELQPLVCIEALASGLGLVVSEASAENLDQSQPFIDVIPNHKLDDINFINDIIKKNRHKSYHRRNLILQYVAKFDWYNIVDDYLQIVTRL